MNGVVLLTGATGYLGREIFKVLIKKNIKIKVLVRDVTCKEILELSDSYVVSEDLFNEEDSKLKEICLDVDTIIHAAWYASHGEYLLSKKNFDCLYGSARLAKVAVESGVRRFIGIGTCAEYDITSGYLSVKTPLDPRSPYAAAKSGLFLALRELLPAFNVEFLWCRLFYLHGGDENPKRLEPYIRSRLERGLTANLSNGSRVRDFLHITDAAELIVDAAIGKICGEVNICSGIPITIKEFSEKIAKEYGQVHKLNFNEIDNGGFNPDTIVGLK